MADDTTLRSGLDRTRINLSQEYEVRYWTNTLGCTEDALRAAIQSAGSSDVEKVREALDAK